MQVEQRGLGEFYDMPSNRWLEEVCRIDARILELKWTLAPLTSFVLCLPKGFAITCFGPIPRFQQQAESEFKRLLRSKKIAAQINREIKMLGAAIWRSGVGDHPATSKALKSIAKVHNDDPHYYHHTLSFCTPSELAGEFRLAIQTWLHKIVKWFIRTGPGIAVGDWNVYYCETPKLPGDWIFLDQDNDPWRSSCAEEIRAALELSILMGREADIYRQLPNTSPGIFIRGNITLGCRGNPPFWVQTRKLPSSVLKRIFGGRRFGADATTGGMFELRCQLLKRLNCPAFFAAASRAIETIPLTYDAQLALSDFITNCKKEYG